MAVNNFLPFCPTDSGTNLLSQSDYSLAADRDVGNQPGIASSKLNNKAIRQATFIASQLAQYLANVTGSDLLDDGNTAALLTIMNQGFSPNSSGQIQNLAIAFSVGAGAATIAIKTQANVDPSANDAIYLGIRSATLTSGLFNRRSITAALSTVISSGSTGGQVSGQPSYLYVYLLDNGGTLELAWSHTKYSETALVTTTAEGGAGGADSATLIYSTTARSNVPIRLVGYILNTQATAGTWASTATQIQLLPANSNSLPTITRFLTSSSGTYVTPAGVRYLKVRVVGGGGGGSGSGSGATAGTAGTASTFGATEVSCNGGAGITFGSTAAGGAGGTASVGAGATEIIALQGGNGGASGITISGVATQAGAGGNNALGGGGASVSRNNTNGVAGRPNSGGGGSGGGGESAVIQGSGGGAGGYAEALITAPLASYAYQVGNKGTGGSNGTSGGDGGDGGLGIIIVEEYYS